jgi:hypothetical protein
MSEATERLAGYLEEHYINDPQSGSPDMAIAIRDLLTDLLHLGREENIDIHQRLEYADEVYQEEMMLQEKG